MKGADPFDPSDTTLRPLAEYTDRLPSRRRGRKLNRATLWRWATRGLQGGRIRLETVRLGGGRFSSDAAVAAFMEAQVCLDDGREQAASASIDDGALAAIRERFGSGSKR
ncbi:MAG: DUF1580 domain-containing protein [bacterium]|nr:DUF1580 domain-containing protein [bacterium]